MDSDLPVRFAFAIFMQTTCEGVVPAWYDKNNRPITYATERQAQLEIVDDLQERLCQFVAGERDFEDAIAIEDFILPVDVWPDGSISTEDGSIFGQRF
ncbi:MAG TPA: hypothetical protein PLG56_02085 [Lacunisphaera sp.]|nr:hypothetical protein [Lacunisphaera sp.]